MMHSTGDLYAAQTRNKILEDQTSVGEHSIECDARPKKRANAIDITTLQIALDPLRVGQNIPASFLNL